MKRTDLILECSRDERATILPPASLDDLKRCQNGLLAAGYPRIPQRYFAFLRNKCNGFDGDFTLYGTKPFHSNISGLVPDIVSANMESGHKTYMKHGLLIGFIFYRSSYENYFYNTRTGLFEVRNNLINNLEREYKTFNALFYGEWLLS